MHLSEERETTIYIAFCTVLDNVLDNVKHSRSGLPGTLMVVNMVVLFTKHIKVMLVNMGIQR